MTIKKLFLVCIIFAIIFTANGAGWCYWGGCHTKTGSAEICPSMADNVGRDNMHHLGDGSCDSWHERLWGRKPFCCTNSCGHQVQKCGKACAKLRMNEVEDTDWTKSIPCTTKDVDGDEIESRAYFCCPQ